MPGKKSFAFLVMLYIAIAIYGYADIANADDSRGLFTYLFFDLMCCSMLAGIVKKAVTLVLAAKRVPH